MANSYVALSSTDRRDWFDRMMKVHKRTSKIQQIFSEKKGAGAIGLLADEQNSQTFVVEAQSPILGKPVPAYATLINYTSPMYYHTVTGTRYGWAQATAVRKITMSDTPNDIIADAVSELGQHWTRLYDQIIVHALSAGADTLVRTETDPDNYSDQLIGLTTFKTVVNTANIGRVALGSTYGEVNAVFAGLQEGGPRMTVGSNTWTGDMDENPRDYFLNWQTFLYLGDYLESRKVRPVMVRKDGSDNEEEVWVGFFPKQLVTQMKTDPQFANFVRYNGEMAKYIVHSGSLMAYQIDRILVVTLKHPDGDMTAGIPLRAELTTDTNFYRVESIICGSQCVAQSRYDTGLEILTANENDFRRKNLLGYDIILGAKKTEMVFGSGSTHVRQNTCSLLHTMYAYAG